MSGPAAGVMAAREVAGTAGYDKVIAFEMGGTSLDIGLVEDGQVRRGQAWDVAFETPVRLPVVDIASIGRLAAPSRGSTAADRCVAVHKAQAPIPARRVMDVVVPSRRTLTPSSFSAG